MTDGAVSSPWNAFLRWGVAAAAASLAETATLPLDGAKVRMQLAGEPGRDGKVAFKRQGMFATLRTTVRSEGPLALWNGLGAAVLRQAVYGGIGVGLYAPVRKLFLGDKDSKDASVWLRMAAGMATGGFGQAVAAPCDVVKTRLQADGRLVLLGKQPRYSGTVDAFVRIIKEEGIAGYYRGLGPSLARATVINGCGIASYDHSKQVVRKLVGREDGFEAKVVGAMVSGLVSALVSSPFDVIKSRLINQPQDVESRLYKGMVDCAIKTVRGEGVFALYKGFLPAWSRLGPWQMVFFPTFEAINKIVINESL